MEHSIFVDANMFVALLNNKDSLHARALRAMQIIRERELKSVTSNFVVSEVITVLSQRSGKRAAVFFANTIYQDSASIDIITVDREIERRGTHYLRVLKSKNVSFCDCVTFAILESFGITRLATFDRDFRIKGADFEIID